MATPLGDQPREAERRAELRIIGDGVARFREGVFAEPGPSAEGGVRGQAGSGAVARA